MERKFLKDLDVNSRTLKKLNKNIFKACLLLFFYPFLMFLFICVFLALFGENFIGNNIGIIVIVILLFSLYIIIYLVKSIMFYFDLRDDVTNVFVNDNDKIYKINTNYVTFELGIRLSLRKETMTDEEAYEYYRMNSGKAPTEEEINIILNERPEGFSIVEYDNCKLINEKKHYYEFSSVKDGVYTIFRIYKIYSNLGAFIDSYK